MKRLNFKINYSLPLLMLIALNLVACGGKVEQSSSSQNQDKSDCRVVEHEMGKTEICGQPQRIVVLGPYLLEPLVALDVQPVAFGDHVAFHQGDYDNPSKQIPYLGSYINQPLANVGVAYTPSIEAIVKVKPDLILAMEGNNAEQYETFSQFAPTLMLSWDTPEANLQAIAKAVNREAKAEQLLQETEQKIQEAKQDFAEMIALHPQMLLLYAQGAQQFFVDNSTELCSSLIKELGFDLLSLPELEASPPDSRTPISLEVLPELDNADSIILFGYNFSDVKELEDVKNFEKHQLSNLQEEWLHQAIAQSMTASQEDRVYYIPAYLCLGLTGPIGTELYLDQLKQEILSKEKL